MQNNSANLHAPPPMVKPGERSNRGKASVRDSSPPAPRSSKITKRPTSHGPSKLRQQVAFPPQSDSVDEEVSQGSSHENASGERTISSRGRKRLLWPEKSSQQSPLNASRPNKVPRLKLRLTREPASQADAPLASAQPATSRGVKLLHWAGLTQDRNVWNASRSSEDEAIHQAAVALFNMRTIKPQGRPQGTLTTYQGDLSTDMPSALRPDALEDEIRRMEEHNSISTAAQTLMSMRYLEPPQGLGAWKDSGFGLLPPENKGSAASDHAITISGDEAEISDDDSEASLLEIRDDNNMFRNDRAVW